jgi:hypothetical protein
LGKFRDHEPSEVDDDENMTEYSLWGSGVKEVRGRMVIIAEFDYIVLTECNSHMKIYKL